MPCSASEPGVNSCTKCSKSPHEHLEQACIQQHGVVSTRQARSFGVNRQYLARSQRWKWVSPGLYRLAAIPTSWRAQLMGAVLAGGHPTLASHRSAALLWGLDGVSEELIEVTMPRNRNRIRICSDPVIVHRSTTWTASTHTRATTSR
jgi:predicted transcriptional regulator of viral defense system